MKDILQKIITNSRWTYPVFEGKIIIEGRILSPQEAEICGLSSALIAKSIMSEHHLRELSRMQQKESIEDREGDDFEDVLKILQGFDADKILEMAESQDKILVNCVKRASIDQGVKWQEFSLVLQENKQSAIHNRLWIGLLPEEDRRAMLDLCMQGHKKADEAIRRSL
tara:strand:+ start:98 stop:601 length:504 start_codon:yes stop_codon:yes gene_type:complete